MSADTGMKKDTAMKSMAADSGKKHKKSKM
jgi:hypothetical protein